MGAYGVTVGHHWSISFTAYSSKLKCDNFQLIFLWKKKIIIIFLLKSQLRYLTFYFCFSCRFLHQGMPCDFLNTLTNRWTFKKCHLKRGRKDTAELEGKNMKTWRRRKCDLCFFHSIWKFFCCGFYKMFIVIKQQHQLVK